MEKNQAVIDAGRYEVANRRFYHPDDLQQVQDHAQPGFASEPSGGSAALPTRPEPTKTGGAGSERGLLERASASRLGNFIHIATNRPSSTSRDATQQEAAELEKARPRAKLQKRSSSKLSVVGE